MNNPLDKWFFEPLKKAWKEIVVPKTSLDIVKDIRDLLKSFFTVDSKL